MIAAFGYTGYNLECICLRHSYASYNDSYTIYNDCLTRYNYSYASYN